MWIRITPFTDPPLADETVLVHGGKSAVALFITFLVGIKLATK